MWQEWIKVDICLELNSMRDALMHFGNKAKASKAVEEVAGYDRDLTRLSTMVSAVIAMLVVLIGSQAAIWIKMGEISGQVAALSARIH